MVRNITTDKPNRTIILALMSIMPVWLAGQIAPQDSAYPAIKVIEPDTTDYSFTNPVLQNDLVYYEFVDTTNQQKGLRSRDLDGNLVHEIVLGGYGGWDFGTFVVADNGTIYAFQQSNNSSYRIHIYTLTDGSYAETGSFGPTGTGEGNFVGGSLSYGRLDVSPVSGNVFVKDYARSVPTDPNNGVILIYDQNGNSLGSFDTNGILAPTLENGILSLDCVENADGLGEIWVRGIYGGGAAFNSQWYKIFEEDGTFKRLFDVKSAATIPIIDGDLLHIRGGNNVAMIPISADEITQSIGIIRGISDGSYFIGRSSNGRLVTAYSSRISVFEQPVFRTFDPGADNAIPNPFVTRIVQRPGTTIMDMEFRVEDADDATVEVAALAFPDGDQNIVNALPLATLVDGTASSLGASIATNTTHPLAWDAGADWNLDFGDLAVMILARDSRTHWFDVHLVEIPADGERPAVTISRNMMDEYDFTMQWLWLMATGDASISNVDGILFGVGGSYDSVQLTDAQGKSTEQGRAFLLERDGLRIATPAEITRAREGATPGFRVTLNPPQRITNSQNRGMPNQINEYGIESQNSSAWAPTSTTLWHVVQIAP